MIRMFAAALAFVALSGFSVEDALQKFDGGWQMADEMFGTGGAVQIDGQARTITATSSYETIVGKFEVEIVGASAIFRVGEKQVVIFSGPTDDVVEVRIGSLPTYRYERVP